MHSDGDVPAPGQAQPWRAADRDPDWPDDWPEPAGPEPGARRRGTRIAALTLTALVALGAGAGAVYLYQSGLAGPAPAASPSQGGAAGPGPGATAGPGQGDNGTVRGMLLLGPVRAVGRGFVTVGAGPVPEVSAQVTNATRFTGAARSLAQVHVGDTVAVQLADANGVARVVSLQDPATAS